MIPDLTPLKFRGQRYNLSITAQALVSSALCPHITPPMTPSPSYSIQHLQPRPRYSQCPRRVWRSTWQHIVSAPTGWCSSCTKAQPQLIATAASHAHPHFRCPPPIVPPCCLPFRMQPPILPAHHLSACLPTPFLLLSLPRRTPRA
ncbi:hypothetical protein M405DRAFT_639882 [Rhizopogon salebrosus TDB-379]|nr:hypothetical protein M405DRAFT_639882 [Rhizopogon salebrosus TDB-379]